MNDKQFQKRIFKDFKTLPMPYYKPELLEFGKSGSYTAVKLKFIVPWNTLKELVDYCKENGLCMDIDDGNLEIILFDTSYNKRVKP